MSGVLPEGFSRFKPTTGEPQKCRNVRPPPLTGRPGEEVTRLYRTADHETAKAALLSFIRDLEGRLSNPANPNAETYKADIVLSYARLAKLEERNNGSEKETYMRQAEAKCQQMKIKRTCSARELRAQVDAADALPVK